MHAKGTVAATSLYEQDETAWLEQTADLVTQGRWNDIDRQHLSEYLIDMALRDKREVLSGLTVLLAHRLKWDFQSSRRTKSWQRTILIQSRELDQLLESRLLRQHAGEVFEKAYCRAVKQAAVETGLAIHEVPPTAPWSLDAALADDIVQ